MIFEPGEGMREAIVSIAEAVAAYAAKICPN